MFLILALYETLFQDLKRLLTLRSFWCKISFCDLIKSLTRTSLLKLLGTIRILRDYIILQIMTLSLVSLLFSREMNEFCLMNFN